MGEGVRAQIDVSIVVPVLNEEANVATLHEQVAAAATGHRQTFELIFVDDGSTDCTAANVRRLIERDSRVCLIQLGARSGQTAALAAGIEHARGQILCTMDGDLQNDPADIPRLLALLDDGHDMVVGWRQDRKDEMLRRRIPSWIANRLIATITKLPIHDIGCGLKVFRSAMVDHVPLYGDLHRFLPAVALIAGSRITETRVNHRPRLHGTSKYSLVRTFEVLLDLFVVRALTAFALRPMRLFSWIALAPLLVGLAFVFRALWLMIDPEMQPSMPSTSTGLLLVGCGLILLLFGIVAELVVRLGDVRDSQIAGAMAHIWVAGS